MASMIVRHRVKDFPAWKKVLDGHASIRESMGCRRARLLRGIADARGLAVVPERDGAEGARRLASAPCTAHARNDAGVLNTPGYYCLEMREAVES